MPSLEEKEQPIEAKLEVFRHINIVVIGADFGVEAQRFA
jgi:hypothetical protein